jgi:hypothetical protein
MDGFRGRVTLALCAVLAGSQLSGCGGNPYRLAEVRGRVTCQGKPATGGVVVFQPIDAPERTGRPKGHPGNSSEGTVGADGTFTLTFAGSAGGAGALLGPHRVFFRMPPTRPPTLLPEERESMSPAEIKAVEAEFSRRPVYPPLPCGANPTPGEVEVKPGDNEFTFTLQPK